MWAFIHIKGFHLHPIPTVDLPWCVSVCVFVLPVSQLLTHSCQQCWSRVSKGGGGGDHCASQHPKSSDERHVCRRKDKSKQRDPARSQFIYFLQISCFWCLFYQDSWFSNVKDKYVHHTHSSTTQRKDCEDSRLFSLFPAVLWSTWAQTHNRWFMLIISHFFLSQQNEFTDAFLNQTWRWNYFSNRVKLTWRA